MKYLPSGTAEGLAYLRYRESLRPPEERICNDFLAYRFSSWWTKLMMAGPLSGGWIEWTIAYQGRGVVDFIAVRTRMFDDFVQQQIDNGIEQYVILGAGLDSRPYRFYAQLHGMPTFEVDHPLTQREKKLRVSSVFDGLPEHISYVPVDLSENDLFQSLIKAGYNPTLRTVFTLEGVAMYLEEETVRRTLTSVYTNSGPGSCLVLDYVYLAAIDGRKSGHLVRHMNSLQLMYDEPVLSGIEEGQAEAYIRSCGFEQAEDFPPQRLYDIYFRPFAPDRPISDIFAVAIARKV